MDVRVEHRDGVAIIGLDRPGSLNALTADVLDAVMEALAESEVAGHPVIVTGTGRAFCAGADLSALVGAGSETSGAMVAGEMERHFNEVVRRLVSADVPVVAAVNGIAAGGGLGLALAADVTIAADTATFVNVFAQQLGLVPDMGASWLVPRAIGRARALGFALLGEPVDADTAKAWGLVWDVVPADELLDRAVIVANRLGHLPIPTLHAVRRTVETSTDGFVPALRTEWELQADLVGRGYLAEGAEAFFEGRRPDFP